MIDVLLALIAVIAGLFLLLVLIYVLFLVRPCKGAPQKKELLCDYAHRGLHGNGIPENSLAAFALACEKGFGIELDIQLSRDGCVMVFHDETLERMTGVSQKLCEWDAKALKGLSLAGTKEPIPTLKEVLTLVDGRVPILVELKGENFDTSLCQKAAAILGAYKGRFCIESFNPLLLKEMRKWMPGVFYGILYTNVCREKRKCSAINVALTWMATNFLAKPNFIAYNGKDRASLPVWLTTKCYHAPKFVWTVRTEEEMKRAHDDGACAIFENI